MARDKFIENFESGEEVEEIFFVSEKAVKYSKNGKPYLDLKLSDRSGSISCKIWDDVDKWDSRFSKGAFVSLRAGVENYQDKLQLRFHAMREAEPEEVDGNDFLDSLSTEQVEYFFQKIKSTVLEMQNPHLKALLEHFLDDPAFSSEMKKCPAAKEVHHNLIGGLVKHICYMLAIAKSLKRIYKEINLDLLISGVILHDIGKIQELNADVTINYTPVGELVGHTVLGIKMIRDKISLIPNFPENLAILLEHMLLSHHGTSDFGAIRLPMFREAILLHMIDNIDAKMEVVSKSLRKASSNEIWTDKVWALDNRKLLQTELFLDGDREVKEEVSQ